MSEYIEREAAIEAVYLTILHDGIRDALKSNIDDVPAADVAPVQRWIPVTERLPEDGVPVLICGDQNAIDIGTYFSEFGHWYDWNSIRTFVHHWYPIPEPPKEEI